MGGIAARENNIIVLAGKGWKDWELCSDWWAVLLPERITESCWLVNAGVTRSK